MLLALVLACAGIALLSLYVRKYERETSGGERVELLAAVKPIPRGTILTADMLATRLVPLAYVEDRAVKAVERTKVIGLGAAVSLSPQQTLQWTDLAITTEDRDLSALVQPGKRGVTIRASGYDDSRSNSLIRPGDYVDVVATMRADENADDESSVVLLQRVLVLAVGRETQPIKTTLDPKNEAARAPNEKSLTLSLDLKEVQLLGLAAERGHLSVAVRNPDDPSVQPNVPDLKASSLFDGKARVPVRSTTTAEVAAAPIRIEDQVPPR
jgi:pilus assembly protein CpaB